MGKLKKIIIIVIAIIILLIASLILFYFSSLSSASNDKKYMNFIIEPGTSKTQIVDNLYSAGLIKNKYATLVYLYLHKNYNLQAGEYVLKKSMTTPEIIYQLKSGKAVSNSYKLTFVEGLSIKKYISLIAKTYNWNESDLLNKIKDKDYLNTLINKYWFLDENILNSGIYYPLEGYLTPNTYEFYKDATFENIIEKMLDHTESILNSHKEEIQNSNFNVHQILTIASICEKEALGSDDRYKVSQVIYKRVANNQNLGMDVTSYYGVQKDMKENITKADLDNQNPYNTRLSTLIGLPIGPICNPSRVSIDAALNPANTDYTWFFADIKTGKVYFTNDYNEFLTFKEIYG